MIKKLNKRISDYFDNLTIRWGLIVYDLAILAVVIFVIFFIYEGNNTLTTEGIVIQAALAGLTSITFRFCFKVYSQVWRYGGIQSYIRLIVSDAVAFLPYYVLQATVFGDYRIVFPEILSVACINLLGALSIRMIYRYAYKCGRDDTVWGRFLEWMYKFFSGGNVRPHYRSAEQSIKIAIIGAGTVGAQLAQDLLMNPSSVYTPVCFIDIDKNKIGREIAGLKVIEEGAEYIGELEKFGVQEVVFTVQGMSDATRKEIYDTYSKAGYRMKVYDSAYMQTASPAKRQMRDFDVEELLFRKPVNMLDEKTSSYYRGKTVLITGGGGSIGSELCRQVAKMQPEKLVILDVYENGAYDVLQDLRILYGPDFPACVEIVSVTNREGTERVFKEHRPDVVIHAAAHKHVPLMEKNCLEAVENNVFGTKNAVELAIEYNAERFIMVSTDKAVNPTNVMGATKRMCEMIVLSHCGDGKTKVSATRFGNVLGSAGSVIPLFRKQIAHGGPVTVTDKRIERYFMTIPEASQLVLTSGAMAKTGELFVLDMGNMVKIYELAESMIRYSGFEPGRDIEIVETGLRPGEKLYEELLIKNEDVTKTENELIFIEKDDPYSPEEVSEKLDILSEAVSTGSDDKVREALMQVIPTFHTPDEVNSKVRDESKE